MKPSNDERNQTTWGKEGWLKEGSSEKFTDVSPLTLDSWSLGSALSTVSLEKILRMLYT